MSGLDPATTVVVMNPAAAGGQVGARRGALEARIRAAIGARIVATERPGHAAELARRAVEAGATTVLSLGGDGTHNEVVNGILSAGPAPGAVALGVLPAGTGGDFRRLLAGGRDLETSLRALAFAHARAAPIDAGVIRYRDDGGAGGTMAERFFLNVASFGIGGLVDRLVNASPKALGGKASFWLGTFRALLRYRPARVRLWVDEREVGEYSVTNICVCNGRFAGGGMMFAPRRASATACST